MYLKNVSIIQKSSVCIYKGSSIFYEVKKVCNDFWIKLKMEYFILNDLKLKVYWILSTSTHVPAPSK